MVRATLTLRRTQRRVHTARRRVQQGIPPAARARRPPVRQPVGDAKRVAGGRRQCRSVKPRSARREATVLSLPASCIPSRRAGHRQWRSLGAPSAGGGSSPRGLCQQCSESSPYRSTETCFGARRVGGLWLGLRLSRGDLTDCLRGALPVGRVALDDHPGRIGLRCRDMHFFRHQPSPPSPSASPCDGTSTCVLPGRSDYAMTCTSSPSCSIC
jgi:hypothetical protein